MNVGEKTVRDAKQVLAETTLAVQQAVERGDISLAAARKLAELEFVEQDEALKGVLEHDTKKARGAAAHRRVANDEQPDARDVLIRAIRRTVQALGGTIRSLQHGCLEVAIHGQIVGVDVTVREAA